MAESSNSTVLFVVSIVVLEVSIVLSAPVMGKLNNWLKYLLHLAISSGMGEEVVGELSSFVAELTTQVHSEDVAVELERFLWVLDT